MASSSSSSRNKRPSMFILDNPAGSDLDQAARRSSSGVSQQQQSHRHPSSSTATSYRQSYPHDRHGHSYIEERDEDRDRRRDRERDRDRDRHRDHSHSHHHHKSRRINDPRELVLPKRQADTLRRYREQQQQQQQEHQHAGLAPTSTAPCPGATANGAHPAIVSPPTYPHYRSSPYPLDTESARMVNLAMNLSASRRRQVSRVGSLGMGMGMGMGRSGANTPHPRQPSWPATANLNTPAPTTPTDAARHFPKRASTTTAATGTTATTSDTLPPIPGAVTVPVALPEDPLRHTASMQDELMNMELSDATLARADKARQHFELFAEYLRLLSHLPPLPPADDTQPQRDGDGDAHGNPRGRTYNPLQYIRNRKVRFREKCPIDSTAEGWDDVGQVRRWVENVASNRPDTRLTPTDCLELPDVLMVGPNDGGRVVSGAAPADRDHAKSDRHGTGTPLQSSISGGETKLRRPRVDWITNPADLIADAAWLERAGNKLKIEDRDGNKLFPRGTRFGRVKLRNAPPTPTTTTTPGRATGAERHTPQRAASASASPPSLSSSQKTRNRAQSRGRSRGRARTRPGERSRSAESDSSGSDEPSTLARLKSKVRAAASRGRSESTLSASLPGEDEEEEEEEEDSGMESDEDVAGARAESRRRKRRLRRRVRALSHRSPTGREGFEDSLGLLDKLALKRRVEGEESEAEVTDGEGEGGGGAGLEGQAAAAAAASRRRARRRKRLLSPIITDGRTPTEDRRKDPSSDESSAEDEDYDDENLRDRLAQSQHARATPVQGRSSIESMDETPLRSTPYPNITINLSPPSSRHPSPEVAAAIARRRSAADPDAVSAKSSRESSLRGRRESSEYLTAEGRSPGAHGHGLHRSMSSLHRLLHSNKIAGILPEKLKVGGRSRRDRDRERDKEKKGSLSRPVSLSSLSATGSPAISIEGDEEKEVMPELPRARSLKGRLVTFPTDEDALSPKDSNDEDADLTPRPPLDSDEPRDATATPAPAADDNDNTLKPPINVESAGALAEIKQIQQDRVAAAGVVPALDGDITADTDAEGLPAIRSTSDLTRVVQQTPAQNALATLKSPSQQARTGIPDTVRNFHGAAAGSPGQKRRRAKEFGRLDRREVDRVEAQLLAAGIRGSELCRLVDEVAELPTYLSNLLPQPPAQPVRTRGADAATTVGDAIIGALDGEVSSTEEIMRSFTRDTLPEVKGSIEELLRLANGTLNPKIRSITLDAEELTSQLATTDTLAVKKLHDALDRGMRKRNNRFHWVHRNGYLVLEWLLIAVMWVVWSFVMLWKVVRVVARWSVQGLRWILWL